MVYVIVPLVALAASLLTFFSGFGLGTLLTPAFVFFFPIQTAVAMTAVVHFLNGLFKLLLVGKRANFLIGIRFAIPAMIAAWFGAHLLSTIASEDPLLVYQIQGRTMEITSVKIVIAFLMALFAALEMWPRFKQLAVPSRFVPVGGLVSGFFGGLSGHQGAFRSVFLLRAGLSKDSFIATGALIAAAIDVARLSVYAPKFLVPEIRANASLLGLATVAAFGGALAGNRLLKKVTLKGVEIVVTVLLFVIAAGLSVGIL